MKMRRLIVAPVIAAILALLIACSNPFAPTATSTDAALVSPEIKPAIEEFLGKLNAHDAAGAGEYFADDPGFQWIENGRVVYEARTAAISGLEAFFAGFGESRIEAYDVKIAMLDDDGAVAAFKFTQTIAANGQASLKLEGTMTLAMTQRSGSWKILIAHKSANAFAH